jgi:Tol biopolymer transport system component
MPRSVVWETPQALGETISTSEDEYEPRISADGQLMLFVRGKAGANADMLFSRRIGWPPEQWGPVESLSSINTDDDELGPELSRDGRWLYFHSSRPGGLGGYDIWRSRLGDVGWSEPENLGPAVNSPYNEYGASLSPDGSQLIFGSNRPRVDEPIEEQGQAWSATLRENLPRHAFDLFECVIEGDQPREADRIDALNSQSNEGSPAFSPDGDFLWFCSDRPGGEGGFDLHRSPRTAARRADLWARHCARHGLDPDAPPQVDDEGTSR